MEPEKDRKKYNLLLCAVLPQPWVAVGRVLEENHYTIKYWIGWNSNNEEQEVKRNFKSAIFHENSKAWRGFPPDGHSIDLDQAESLPIGFWDSYRAEMQIAYKMFDRLDSDAYSFSYSEREDFLFDLATYWYNALRKHEINAIIFSVVPHRGFDYVMYLVAKFAGIPTLLFKSTYVPGLKYAIEAIDASFWKHNLLRPEITENNYSLLQAKADRFRKEEQDVVVPEYMRRQRKTNNIQVIFKRFFWHLLPKNIFRKSVNNLKYKNIDYYRQSPVNYQLAIRESFLAHYRKRQLHAQYGRYTDKPEFSSERRYYFFALHYQPEETTVPSAGNFYNQFNLIKHISKCLPADGILLVKEHTTQFHPAYDGEKGRYPNLYANISTLKNVSLIDEKLASIELIKKSEAVFTLTGTVGFEALLLGKPVFVFGNAWYRIVPGAIDVFSRPERYDQLRKILANLPMVDVQHIDNFFRGIAGYLLPVSPYKKHQKNSILSQQENEQLIAEFVTHWIKTLKQTS